jgi:hypothetical protein
MKTAVEWLEEQMLWNEFHNPFLEQAKQMEKEQIINAYENLDYDDGNEYYNETFKQQEQ